MPTDLFGNTIVETSKVVNISSVPQRSPFRYPGGKTWLVPQARKWFKSCLGDKLLIEPFCGGGIIGLTAAFEFYFPHVLFSEIDKDIAAVWKTMLNDDCDWLVKQIYSFEPTRDNLISIIDKPEKDCKELALATILRNRTCHGGILAKGSGLMKNGENGKGVFSRWYSSTIAKRIEAIHRLSPKMSFVEGNAFDIIQQHVNDSETAFFIDPPYTIAGKRLYTHFDIDHHALFDLVSSIKGHYMLTYDNVEDVRKMADEHGLQYCTIPMQTTHLIVKKELIISDNFDWLKSITTDRVRSTT